MIAAREQERYFTPEEYFAWEEQQLERHELIHGRVYAMSGGTQNHSAIKLNIGSLSLPIEQFYEEIVFESQPQARSAEN